MLNLPVPIHAIFFIIILLVGGVYIHYKHFNAKWILQGPTIFTTAGIFATFFGIALGLYDFKASNIQASVPALLDGLKTAFWASVIGVGIALSIKIRFALWGIPVAHQETDVHGSTIDDLVKHIMLIQHALVGEDDSTLISQIKLGRQDTNDRLDSLRRSQEAFMEKMADNNSKALIQALQEVIRDFNAKINEQFGENFKHLNEAVGKILEWQETYRQQMQEMIMQQTETASNMSLASKQFSAVVTNSQRFAVIAADLQKMMLTMENQKHQMEQMLKSLGQLLTNASGSLPLIEKKIMELTAQMTNGVKTNNEDTTRAIREIASLLQNAVSEVQKTTIATLQEINREFNNNISQITSKTQEQVQTLDVALERELTKSLDTLARQLTALSQRFVEDYTPLTERLRQIVNISKGV